MTKYEPEEAIFAEGPWTHRDVSANGARFHVVEAGTGPLVLMVHGFPTFWYMWKDLIVDLADNGYRAVAMDLRGYGGSDHPPRGYDFFTASRDIDAVVRSLGESSATLVGHGFGGLLTWSAASLNPDLVKRHIAVSSAHPNRLRYETLHNGAQRKASSFVWGLQRPWVPERQLVANDAQAVEDFLRQWSVDESWITKDTAARYRAAFQSSNTAHCAVEYYRWMVRSLPRPDGRRFTSSVAEARVQAPVLQLHGAGDPTILPSTAEGSGEFVSGMYEWQLIANAGHYLPEENPTIVGHHVVDWLNKTPV